MSRSNARSPNAHKKQQSFCTLSWQTLTICVTIVMLPWVLFVSFRGDSVGQSTVNSNTEPISTTGAETQLITKPVSSIDTTGIATKLKESPVEVAEAVVEPVMKSSTTATKSAGSIASSIKMKTKATSSSASETSTKLAPIVTGGKDELPVLGPIPTKGAQPLWGVKHQGGDAIFALACNYPKEYYQRFVGSLRKFGYEGDIVLAVSPPEKMKPGVANYVKATKVVAYGFEVDCAGTDNCKLKDEFLGYPDPRPHRTFANIRYALYEYWLRYYSERSYILILDFRDTFFQDDPFKTFGPVATRTPKYELQMFAENYKVKSIGKCVFNSLWVGRCFGKEALEKLKKEAVICSGSTLGSYPAIHHYIRTMLKSMDSVKCWLKGIESDQGYQNYLFYNGHFNTAMGNATLFHQGEGVVNTIGAMNGFRVPKDQKGPLDTFWKIRDSDGWILNNDKTRSACVHQWDRWFSELHKFVDTKLYDKNIEKKALAAP